MAKNPKENSKKMMSATKGAATAVQILQEKLEVVFDIGSEDSVETLVVNALNTYIQLGKFSSDGLSVYMGKDGSGELLQLRFPFEDIEEIKEPSVKLKNSPALGGPNSN